MDKPLAIIIEDDIEISKIYRIVLQTEFDIEIFHDGYQALARLAQVIPALVILDLNMPNISGSEVLQKIRADERLAKIPVMLATADTIQAASLSEDADLVLVKPISPIQLRELASRLRSKDASGGI